MGFLPVREGKRLFVSWVPFSSRSASFAQAMGAIPFFAAQGRHLFWLKYKLRAIATLWTLLRERPQVVFCMNPPYFVAWTAYLYCLLFDAVFTMDSHSAAFDSRKWTWMMPLHAFLVKRAAFSTVTNEELKARVEAMGGTGLVVTDIPYTMPPGDYPVKGFSVCFVCTFGEDEPVLEVLEAARMLPDVSFYITGNAKKVTERMRKLRSPNVTFTGYLSNEEYAGLLRAASVVLVLTTRDFTMQRGGSEAVTVGRPLITSDWPVLRETFYKGTIHVPNTAADIAAAIEVVRAGEGQYRQEMAELAAERAERWEATRREIDAILDGLSKPRKPTE